MSTTVAELIQRAREYADARDDGDDPYISDTALLAWLNQENRKLVRRLARCGYPWGEVRTSFTTTTTITDNLVTIVGVFDLTTSNRPCPVPRLMDGGRQPTDGRFWTAATTAVGVTTVTIGAPGTYQVRYVPTPSKLVLGTPGAGEVGSVYYPAGWEEVLVVGAALRAKAKEGSDNESPFLRQLYQDEWDEVEVEASNSTHDPVVQNVDWVYPVGYAGTNGPSPDLTLTWWWP